MKKPSGADTCVIMFFTNVYEGIVYITTQIVRRMYKCVAVNAEMRYLTDPSFV